MLMAILQGVGFTADWLVESMNEVSTTISKEWVGLILLPAVGSLAGSYLIFEDEDWHLD